MIEEQLVHYQVCKYDKSSTDYLSEWTSLEELLRSRNCDQPSIPIEYLEVEYNYLKFVDSLLSRIIGTGSNLSISDGILNFDHVDLQSHSDIALALRTSMFGELSGRFFTEITQQSHLTTLDVLLVVQLALRNLVCTSIRLGQESYITVGDDYYLLIGVPRTIDLKSILRPELYSYRVDYGPLS